MRRMEGVGWNVSFQIYLLTAYIEMGSRCVAGVDLKLLGSSDPPTLASQSARIIGMSHQTLPQVCGFKCQLYMLVFKFILPAPISSIISRI